MGLLDVILRTKRRLLTTVLIALLIGFTLLSCVVVLFPPSFLDLEFSEEVQEHHNSLLDQFMIFISWFGNIPISIIMVVIVAVVFYLFNYKREFLFVLLTLCAGIVSSALKILINRPRPTQSLVRIVEHAKQQSFPSGHTLFYVVFFGFLVIVMGNLKSLPGYLRITVVVISLLMILLVPISRVYLGAHWFTDVFGGAMLGMICLFVLGYLYLIKPSPETGK